MMAVMKPSTMPTITCEWVCTPSTVRTHAENAPNTTSVTPIPKVIVFKPFQPIKATAMYTVVYKSVYACEDGIPGSVLIPSAEDGRLWLSNTFKAFEIQALALMPMTAQVTCGLFLRHKVPIVIIT